MLQKCILLTAAIELKSKIPPFFPLRNAFAIVVPMSGLSLSAAVLYLFKFQDLWVIDEYSHWLKYKGIKNRGTAEVL